MKQETAEKFLKKHAAYTGIGLYELSVTDMLEFARLVELETLERAAEKMESQHVWITNVAASSLIRSLSK